MGTRWPAAVTIARSSCSFDRTLRVRDVASGACVHILAGHTRPVSKLAFAPDGRLLASGGFDWAVKLWDLASGQCLQTFAGHTSAVKAIAWSPDGRSIASSSYDATIRLWELNRDTAQRVLQGPAASVNAIAFTAESSTLIRWLGVLNRLLVRRPRAEPTILHRLLFRERLEHFYERSRNRSEHRPSHTAQSGSPEWKTPSTLSR